MGHIEQLRKIKLIFCRYQSKSKTRLLIIIYDEPKVFFLMKTKLKQLNFLVQTNNCEHDKPVILDTSPRITYLHTEG